MKKHLLIAGGSGLIGSVLSRNAAAQEWEVTILSRTPGPGIITWDPDMGIINLQGKIKVDALVNLAGTSISDGRWTESRKQAIYESRMKSCRTLENYLFDGRITTDVYLGASAIGIYGDSNQEKVNERTQIKKDNWFTNLVVEWEKCHKRVEALEIRTLILRIGIVLSKEDGALREILKSAPFGILPLFGSGKQIWSWIHIDDVAAMILYCLDNNKISGIHLATAPEPVAYKTLINALNDHLRKIIAPVPKFMLSIILGEMHRVVFDSCNAPPQKILQSGFKFEYETIEEALESIAKEI